MQTLCRHGDWQREALHAGKVCRQRSCLKKRIRTPVLCASPRLKENVENSESSNAHNLQKIWSKRLTVRVRIFNGELENMMHYRNIILIPLLSALLSALLFSTSAFAHHGWSEYDTKQPLQVTGTIQESGYSHPHGHISLKTEGKTWNVVLAPPTRMENRGLSKEMLSPGKKATVVGYPNRNKPEEMRAERIIIDEKTTELR